MGMGCGPAVAPDEIARRLEAIAALAHSCKPTGFMVDDSRESIYFGPSEKKVLVDRPVAALNVR